MIRQPSTHLQTKRELIAAQLEALPAVNKPRKDGSALFKCVGGPYHDITIRMYAPWVDVILKDGTTYTYSDQPIGQRSKAHIYVCKN